MLIGKITVIVPGPLARKIFVIFEEDFTSKGLKNKASANDTVGGAQRQGNSPSRSGSV